MAGSRQHCWIGNAPTFLAFIFERVPIIQQLTTKTCGKKIFSFLEQLNDTPFRIESKRADWHIHQRQVLFPQLSQGQESVLCKLFLLWVSGLRSWRAVGATKPIRVGWILHSSYFISNTLVSFMIPLCCSPTQQRNFKLPKVSRTLRIVVHVSAYLSLGRLLGRPPFGKDWHRESE